MAPAFETVIMPTNSSAISFLFFFFNSSFPLSVCVCRFKDHDRNILGQPWPSIILALPTTTKSFCVAGQAGRTWLSFADVWRAHPSAEHAIARTLLTKNKKTQKKSQSFLLFEKKAAVAAQSYPGCPTRANTLTYDLNSKGIFLLFFFFFVVLFCSPFFNIA